VAFIHEIRVHWGDCDPAKIAFTGNIPNWAIQAIDAWWDAHVGAGGWYHTELDRGFGSPFVHMEMDFRAPITPRHRLICEVAPTRLGETSVGFRVVGRQEGVLCFEGTFVCVFVASAGFNKMPPPDDVRAAILAAMESSEG
jgi:4-hydroxybenzoyl-CoA thioesterase